MSSSSPTKSTLQDWEKADSLAAEVLDILLLRNEGQHRSKYSNLSDKECDLKINNMHRELKGLNFFNNVREYYKKAFAPEQLVAYRRVCLARLLFDVAEASLQEESPQVAKKHLKNAYEMFYKSPLVHEITKITPKFRIIIVEFKTQLFKLDMNLNSNLDSCKQSFWVIPWITENKNIRDEFESLLNQSLEDRLYELEASYKLNVDSFPFTQLNASMRKFVVDVALELNSLYAPKPYTHTLPPPKDNGIAQIFDRNETAERIFFSDEEELSESNNTFAKIPTRPRRSASAKRSIAKATKRILGDDDSESPEEELSVNRTSNSVPTTWVSVNSKRHRTISAQDSGDHSPNTRNVVTSTVHSVPSSANSNNQTKSLLQSQSTLRKSPIRPVSKIASSPENQSASRRHFELPTKRHKWTEDELQALEEGMIKYAKRWAVILEEHGPAGSGRLVNRDQVALKDKARVEKNRRMKLGIDLGIFSIATDR